jgi:hypothetical protein
MVCGTQYGKAVQAFRKPAWHILSDDGFKPAWLTAETWSRVHVRCEGSALVDPTKLYSEVLAKGACVELPLLIKTLFPREKRWQPLHAQTRSE